MCNALTHVMITVACIHFQRDTMLFDEACRLQMYAHTYDLNVFTKGVPKHCYDLLAYFINTLNCTKYLNTPQFCLALNGKHLFHLYEYFSYPTQCIVHMRIDTGDDYSHLYSISKDSCAKRHYVRRVSTCFL